MRNFEYYAPTDVVFGTGAEARTGELVRRYGGTRVLLHYGGGSAVRSGLVSKVTDSLKEAGIAVVELGGVVPNPRLALVQKGIELCREAAVDFILAVGGGSVIDSAKAIAYGVPYEGNVWDFYAGDADVQQALPVGTVLTIAAAGSEMSNSSVITNEELGQKRGYGIDPWGRCKFAIMNPELTTTLPAYPTACGVADILMHTMERYFTPEPAPMAVTTGIAESLLRSVMEAGHAVTRTPDDYDVRANLMWAGSLSHNGLTQCGGDRGDWACHAMGHEISAAYDLAHGASLTCLWGSWARYVYKTNVDRFVAFATNVMQLPPMENDEEMALAGIEEMEGFFWAIEMPTSFEEADITPTDEELHAMAEKATHGGSITVGKFRPLETQDVYNIYKNALHPAE